MVRESFTLKFQSYLRLRLALILSRTVREIKRIAVEASEISNKNKDLLNQGIFA